MESKVIIPPTLPTFGHATIYVYPTVSPKVVVVPILTCIFGFPVLVLLIICALRYRARKARTTAKKSTMRRDPSVLELTSGPSILARCSSGKEPKSSFKKKKTLVRFKPMPEIDLDTVLEEKSEFDAEVTASDLLTTPEEFVIPEEDTPVASFKAYRYMGAVQGAPVPKSPIKTTKGNQQLLDEVAEEFESNGSYEMEIDEDEDTNDNSEGNDVYDEELNTYGKDKPEGRIVEGSSGSSDSDSTAVCFPLSPKQVTKSPTAVHLALKKLDGVMSRRHSSPVKVNYGSQRAAQQRSSGKTNYSYTGEDGKLMPKKKSSAVDDYIDRELMPAFSSCSSSSTSKRSYSVKTPSRKSQSFCSRRRGDSFKTKKQILARSISHKLTSSEESVKKPDLIEMGECNKPVQTDTNKLQVKERRSPKVLGKSLSVGPTIPTSKQHSYNVNSHCEARVVNENKENECSGFNNEATETTHQTELQVELHSLSFHGVAGLTNGGGSGTENLNMSCNQDVLLSPEVSPTHLRARSYSASRQNDDTDHENSSRRRASGGMGLGSARKAWAENRLEEATCPVLPLKSPERLIGSIGNEKERNASDEKHYGIMVNDYALRYREDENSGRKSPFPTCTITVDSDDERSTLV